MCPLAMHEPGGLTCVPSVLIEMWSPDTAPTTLMLPTPVPPRRWS